MLKRRKWANDEIIFKEGQRVLLRLETDGNPKSRKPPLNDHKFEPTYTINAKIGDNVELRGDKGQIIIAHKGKCVSGRGKMTIVI